MWRNSLKCCRNRQSHWFLIEQVSLDKHRKYLGHRNLNASMARLHGNSTCKPILFGNCRYRSVHYILRILDGVFESNSKGFCVRGFMVECASGAPDSPTLQLSQAYPRSTVIVYRDLVSSCETLP